MKRALSVLILGATLTVGAASCSSDKKSPTTTAAPAATTIAGGSATTVAGGTDSGSSAAVADYCKQVDALIVEVKAVLADPSKSAELATLQTKVTDLTAAAAKLSGSSAADAQAVSACSQKLATAFTPG